MLGQCTGKSLHYELSHTRVCKAKTIHTLSICSCFLQCSLRFSCAGMVHAPLLGLFCGPIDRLGPEDIYSQKIRDPPRSNMRC